jgi:hypothetical protein
VDLFCTLGFLVAVISHEGCVDVFCLVSGTLFPGVLAVTLWEGL